MRTYNMLKARVHRFQQDAEIQQLIKEINTGDPTYEKLLSGGYSANTVNQLKAANFDIDTIAQRGYGYERLDQLTVELIMGVR
jgi:xylose isomerase